MIESIFRPTSILDGSELETVVDLGMHSFADSFIPSTKLTTSEPIYPLQVGGDFKNGLFQNLFITPAELRYNL